MGLEYFRKRWHHIWSAVAVRVNKPRKRKSRLPRVAIEDLEIRCFLSASSAFATVIQPDGKTIVVGSAEDNSNGNRDFAISRLNPDGSPDISFNGTGTVLMPFNLLGAAGGEDVATSVALQNDGKIVVGGYAQASSSGDYNFAVLRLNSNGSADSSFGIGGKSTVAFQAGGNFDDRASAVAVTHEGQIVLGGTVTKSVKGDTDFGIARLTSNGILDATFSSDGLKTIAFNSGGDKIDTASSLVVQSNGAIVIAGSAQRSRSGDYDFAVARVTARGDMDKSFAGSGKRTIAINEGGQKEDVAQSVALQGTNIVLGGHAQVDSQGNFDYAVVRLQKNGNLDRTFGQKGKQTAGFDFGGLNQDRGLAVVAQDNGRVMLAGSVQLTDTGNSDFGLIRFTPNGSLDPTFGVGGKVLLPVDLTAEGQDVATSATMDPLTGQFTIVGTANTDDVGNSDIAVARFTSSGLLDTLFAMDGIASLNFGTPLPPV